MIFSTLMVIVETPPAFATVVSKILNVIILVLYRLVLVFFFLNYWLLIGVSNKTTKKSEKIVTEVSVSIEHSSHHPLRLFFFSRFLQ